MDIITVYFVYGLSFFSMGLAVLLEVGRSSELDFARALRYLAGFGLVHGIHEWLEMFLLIFPESQGLPFYQWVGTGRVILLAISFLFLISFGARLVVGPGRTQLAWQMLGSYYCHLDCWTGLVVPDRAPRRKNRCCRCLYPIFTCNPRRGIDRLGVIFTAAEIFAGWDERFWAGCDRGCTGFWLLWRHWPTLCLSKRGIPLGFLEFRNLSGVVRLSYPTLPFGNGMYRRHFDHQLPSRIRGGDPSPNRES